MKLAYVGKIIQLEKVPNADRLLHATTVCGAGGKWEGVVSITDGWQQGDTCTVFLPDSILPDLPQFAFMRKYGHRVRMQRFRGLPSEVLIIKGSPYGERIGDDVTAEWGVKKYEKPYDARMAGDVAGKFPSFIPKTDEPNFQTAERLVAALVGKNFIATEKEDGSSGTFFNWEGVKCACSRNLMMKECDTNLIWLLAKKYRLPEIMPYGFALQYEMVGPKIQGNRLKLTEPDIRAFSMYDIANQCYCNYKELHRFCTQYKIPIAPIVYSGIFTEDMARPETLRAMAEGEYANGGQREGLVFRPEEERVVYGQRLSFKVINLLYKD